MLSDPVTLGQTLLSLVRVFLKSYSDEKNEFQIHCNPLNASTMQMNVILKRITNSNSQELNRNRTSTTTDYMNCFHIDQN